jgi:heme/copper-type cytochrome/quinol oxidase subunit 3
MPRRVYTYGPHPGWTALNAVSTVGAFLMGLGVLVFVWNIVRSLRVGAVAGDNPWDAFTLEWATTSPPGEGNFTKVPPVRSRRPVWDMNYPDKADWKVERTPEDHRGSHSAVKISMSCFIASEAMFFLLLISSYIVFNRGTVAAQTAHLLEVGRSGFFTLLLLGSSVTLWLAERALRKFHRQAFLNWLAMTLGLGALFLINQTLEYTGLIRSGFTVNTNLFGSTFFTLTGFHGLHVLAGLIMLSVMFILAKYDYLTAARSEALAAIGYYWHFVDVVWIVVFSIVYLRVLT